MSQPRILILSASVGAGHVRAAQAIESACKANAPGATVKHFDVLSMTSALFRRVYAKAYLDLANRAPHVIAYLYDITDRPPGSKSVPARLHRLVERLNTRDTIKLVNEGWDVIICTHFMPAELLSRLKRKKQLITPICTVVTDFDSHGLWAVPHVERFFVAPEPWAEARRGLMHWGIEGARIVQTGIPVDPVFAARLDRDEARRRHGIPLDRPCALMLSGGFGVGPIERGLRELVAARPDSTPVHVVAVAGKNAKLKATLDRVKPAPGSQANVTVLGFTDKMHELMAAADLVITKPGGLTTSEALSRGCAIAIMNPIPGQEERNSDMLLEAGAAIKINNLFSLGEKVVGLLGDAERLRRMREAARGLGRPNAAVDVARSAMELI